MPRVKNTKAGAEIPGFATTTVRIVDLNYVSARRVIPGDVEWPALVQLTFTPNLATWDLERHTPQGWTHLGRITRGALVNLQFNMGEPEPRWRLVEVPA